jgi:AcrR family transcriptional regulator
MRVTAQAKAATRQKLLDAARRLFARNGFEATTTRDIARAAEIASGTLFNYFPTKEAVLACLASEASAEAITEVEAGPRSSETLEEDLFDLVATGLRKLQPLRKYLPVLLETALSPMARASQDDSASLRTDHLEAVAAAAARHGHGALSATALQLYWTLYTGVLVFWANDASPKQEDTLALTDESLNMFSTWLRGQPRDESTQRI